MSNVGAREMPVIEAYPVMALRGDHWRAVFPEGERTYPTREAMVRAGARIGSAVRLNPTPTTGPDGAGERARVQLPVPGALDQSSMPAVPRTRATRARVRAGSTVERP